MTFANPAADGIQSEPRVFHKLSDVPRLTPTVTGNKAIDVVAGFLAGLCCSIAFYPLELVEARMQVDARPRPSAKRDHRASHPRPAGMLELAADIWRREGPAGFVLGAAPAILGGAVNSAIYFAVFESARAWFKLRGHGSLLADLLGGVLAGLVCNFLVTPFWVLKIRLISAPRYRNSMAVAAAAIAREEGLAAFWQGLLPGILGISDGAIHFLTYEQLKAALALRLGPGEALTGLHFFFIGAAAKVVAVVLTYWTGVLANRMRAGGASGSLLQCARQIYKADGLAGFYAGLSVSLARNVLPAGFFFLLVELMRRALTLLAEAYAPLDYLGPSPT